MQYMHYNLVQQFIQGCVQDLLNIVAGSQGTVSRQEEENDIQMQQIS